MIPIDHPAVMAAILKLREETNCPLIASANCEDNFTLFFARAVFYHIMDALDLESWAGIDTFNELCEETHWSVRSDVQGPDRYRDFVPDRSKTIRHVCHIVWIQLTKPEASNAPA